MKPGNETDDWDQHWSRYDASAELNPGQAWRRRLVAGLLAANGPPRRIVDIGCGQGQMLEALNRGFPGAELLGLDHSRIGIEISRHRVPTGRFAQVNLLDAAGEPTPELARWATEAVCVEVLEHVDDPVLLLRNARTYLAGGCRVVVTTPGGPMSAFDRHIGHRRHFSPAELGRVVEESGLTLERGFGAGYPTFNLYRMVVISRGEALVEDAADDGTGVSAPARAAMAGFRLLMHLPTVSCRFGWQSVAIAREP